MEWHIIAIILAVPLIIFSVIVIWFANFSGIYRAVKRKRRERAARKFELAIALDPPGDC